MIVKNEEETIGRCLQSVAGIADEIIIVDTGSTDRTKGFAQVYTTHVFDFEWIDDFSAARNYAFSKATMDYILWLDADDVILEEDRRKFLHLKQTLDPSVDIVMMKYNVGFDAGGNVTLSYYRERLSRRVNNYKWQEPVHEYLALSGKIINSDICISHKKIKETASGRNVAIYEKLLSTGGKLTPRGTFYYARELYYNGRYEEAITRFNEFLDSGKGWFEDNISASCDLSKCYSLLKDDKNAIKAVLRSLEYDTPRSQACCQIGYHFKNKADYGKAIFWFEMALTAKMPAESWGFNHHDYSGYIPCIELCVCYDKLGDPQHAVEYNERADTFRPNDSSVLYNRKYFEGLKTVNIKKASCPAGKLTLSMPVRNESAKFLKEVLKEASRYIDNAVIIDDASTDNSVAICSRILKKIPYNIIHNNASKFANEIDLRKQQWNETVKTDPDWILFLDADEMFERDFRTEVRNMMSRQDIDVYCFRLYDMWDPNHYREDRYWNAHMVNRPFLVRYRKDFPYVWKETPQHCGRLPANIYSLPNDISPLRLKHYGWSRPKLRREKYERYLRLDPGALYGIKEQYESILDENPNLVEWNE